MEAVDVLVTNLLKLIPGAGTVREGRYPVRQRQHLCDRYRHLLRSGKNTKHANVAVARELEGFVRDIVRVEMPRLPVAPGRVSGSPAHPVA